MAESEYTERSDIILDGSTATWEIQVDGEIQGTYMGTFKFKCVLTPLQKIAANREYRELLGPHMTMAPEHESNLAFALTQLKHRIVSAPPFWGTGGSLSGDLPDTNVIMAVLDAAVAAELKYAFHMRNKKTDAIQKARAAAERMLAAKDEAESEEEG